MYVPLVRTVNARPLQQALAYGMWMPVCCVSIAKAKRDLVDVRARPMFPELGVSQ